MYSPFAFGQARLPPQIDIAIGATALVYIVWAKASELQFRRRAIVVDAVVLKSFSHSRFTSYFVAYSYQNRQRVAEYCGLPLVTEFQVGQTIRVLIDGAEPPDVAVPETAHHAPDKHAGTCSLEGKALFSLWDVVFTLGVIGLILWRVREL